MHAIEIIGVTKKYDNTVAVKDLHLSVKQGEVFGFIGKNGAGKTTTINIILSMIHKDEGIIKVNDKPITFNDENYKKSIGFVPDVPVFPSYMNAKEYLKYTVDIFHATDYDIEETLDFVGLKGQDKRISNYSRGMKQRLAIAQALVHNPDIIIMDEPTSALDPIGRKDVLEIIRKLKGTKTIFYSTHILEDAEKVCDRIGLINEGSLLLVDTMDNIKHTYYKDHFYIETESKREDLFELIDKKYSGKATIKDKGVMVDFNTDKTTNNEVLSYLIENGEKIVTLMPLSNTLEDVFIEVTK
jgi:ABC-2 type transport system ATP-binding protein